MLSICSGDAPAMNSTNSNMCTGRSLSSLELDGNCPKWLGESTWMENLRFKADRHSLERKIQGQGRGWFHLGVCALFQCNWCLCLPNTEVLHVALTTAADGPSRLQESIQVPPAPSSGGDCCGKTLPGWAPWQGERPGCLKRGGGDKGCAETLCRAAGGFVGQEWGWGMSSFCWCPSSCGHHLQKMLQSLPGIFLASCFGLCRNLMKSTLAAGE